MMKTCLVPLTLFNQCFNAQWGTCFVKLTFNMMLRVIVLKFLCRFAVICVNMDCCPLPKRNEDTSKV